MKILVCSDISSATKANPFTVELIKALASQKIVESVEHGTFWIDSEVHHWDVVLLQWPELLVRPGSQITYDKLAVWTRRIGTRATVLSIVHNLGSHYRSDSLSQRLYELVNTVSDGFVHLGEASVQSYRERYPETAQKPVLVVPHGNYTCFGESIAVQEARQRLRVRQRGPVALVLGELRAHEEFDLVLDCAKAVRQCGGYLLLAGRLPVVSRNPGETRIRTYVSLFMRAMYFFSRSMVARSVVLHEREIPNQLMTAYLGAADILIIPRINALNSGNVALGFTYGRVVVGPDIENIGCALRETGNPVFNPADRDSVQRAVHEGFRLAQTGVGEQNRNVARMKWGWTDVGAKIVAFASAFAESHTKTNPGVQ